MGWGKYFEDDVSIYVGRMYMRSVSNKSPKKQSDGEGKRRVYHSKPRPANPIENRDQQTIHAIDENKRNGLELIFLQNIDKSTERKLQLNRWWHRQGTNIWYNNNTVVNRNFARQFVDMHLAKLSTVRPRDQ